jgi:hypothetical protein
MRPDSPMALSRSRHPITEAGLDTIVTSLEGALKDRNASDPAAGQLTYEGLKTPDGLDHPCHSFKRLQPDGETWLVAIDPKTQLPALVEAIAPGGELLERYAFRDLRANLPELAKAEAFDPNGRWGEPQGLFSRLARAGGADPKATDPGPR